MSIQIKALKEVSIEKITDTFNLAFSDYFVPVNLTPEIMASKMKVDKVNPDFSVGVFDDNQLIAFILHGTDIIDGKNVIYNGGTGVIPEKRGQGFTKQMYDFILPVLKEEGIDYLVLEVITKNIQAIKSYERVGYKVIRTVKCYEGQVALMDYSDNVDIRKLAIYDWNLMQSFWDFLPTWQNSANVAERMKDVNQSFAAYINQQLVGYIIFSPGSKRIQQIAVDQNFRRKGIASRLIAEIIKESGNKLAAVNLDESSEPINSFFSKLGLGNYLDQLEMKLILS